MTRRGDITMNKNAKILIPLADQYANAVMRACAAAWGVKLAQQEGGAA